MSHFTVLVIGANPERQLAPFQENNMGDCPKSYLKFNESEDCDIDEKTGKRGYWENPNAKWDWYQLGGCWTGFFKLKAGQLGVPGEPGLMTPAAKPGYADAARKGAIDFDGMRDEAERDARNTYRKTLKLFGGEIPTIELKWADLLKQSDLSIDQRGEIYHGQAALRRTAQLREEHPKEFSFFFSIEDFQCTEDVYAQRARNQAISTYAVLKEGQWYERGQMGWWGAVFGEKDGEVWESEFNKLLDATPANTLLSVYDCHI